MRHWWQASSSSVCAVLPRIQIAPGKIRISISVNDLAALLKVDPQRVSETCLEIASAFQNRKRGVETKLVPTSAANPRDETLFRNIARAHRYFEMIRTGKSYAEIAKGEGVSKHRFHKLLGLAFLAPDDHHCIAQPQTATVQNSTVQTSIPNFPQNPANSPPVLGPAYLDSISFVFA